MKKIVLLVLIVLIIPIIIVEDTSKDYSYYNDNYPDLPKDEKWEYVKERVFNGFNENVHKYSGPILCELYNATSKDSTAVNEILKELKVLLPNKAIDYFKNYVGRSLDDTLENKNSNVRYHNHKLSDLKKVTIKLHFEENEETYNLFGLNNL